MPLPYNMAVRQERRSSPKSLDFFPTQPWAVRALVEHVLGSETLAGRTVVDPANGAGDIARALAPYAHAGAGGAILQSDIADYRVADIGGLPVRVGDFLAPLPEVQGDVAGPVDWIVTNPPFNQAAKFIARARSIAREGVAMIVRSSFLESVGRYRTIFRSPETRPTEVWMHSERVPMFIGRLEPHKSSATSYAWLVWRSAEPRVARSAMDWIPPCRKDLEMAEDYHGWRWFSTPWGPLPRQTFTKDTMTHDRLERAFTMLRQGDLLHVRRRGTQDQASLTLVDASGYPLARLETPAGTCIDDVAPIAGVPLTDEPLALPGAIRMEAA